MATSSAQACSGALRSQLPPQLQSSLFPESAQHVVIPTHSPRWRAGALSARPPIALSHWHSKSLPAVRAISTAQETSEDVSTGKVTKYHFLVANAKFMLDDEEHFQELMRERLRNFEERKREQDFWLVIEPQFLDKFPDITLRLGRPAVALVSTDELWITFMKLRLDKVLRGEIEEESLMEALKSNPVELSFDKPHVWTAPYSKYEGPWWTPFLPPAAEHHK